ncbi:MAG: hypothetical protein K0Q79_2474 [Flavipsychrobacter sp.]|jgi:hypothetical protein|nr:hypothetical protein [Flavipsychrobacter sp.]
MILLPYAIKIYSLLWPNCYQLIHGKYLAQLLYYVKKQ